MKDVHEIPYSDLVFLIGSRAIAARVLVERDSEILRFMDPADTEDDPRNMVVTIHNLNDDRTVNVDLDTTVEMAEEMKRMLLSRIAVYRKLANRLTELLGISHTNATKSQEEQENILRDQYDTAMTQTSDKFEVEFEHVLEELKIN